MDARQKAAFEAEKRANTLQVLLKVARLVNERSIARVNVAAGKTVFRQALANLVPHIALEGTGISELARKVGVSKQAVSKLVSELASQGFVDLVPDPSDGRGRLVKFTPAGLRGLRQGLAAFQQVELDLARTVGEPRLKRLREDLLAVLDALEAPR